MKIIGKCILVILTIALLSISFPANIPVFADSSTSGDISLLQEPQTIEVTLLGPNQYIRTSGQPNVYADAFPGVEGTGRLIVENGHESGESRVSSAVVTVNEARVLGPRDFNLEVGHLETTIDLHELNEITVELRSTEESFVTVSIVQEVEAEAAAVIGPGGGSIEVTDPESPILGAELIVPYGAMNDTVVLSLSLGIVVGDPGFVGIPVLCSPDGYQFNNDIELIMPLGEAASSDNLLMLMVYNPATDTYEYDGRLAIVNSGDTHASANIDHFSSFWWLDIFDPSAPIGTAVDQALMLLAIGTAYQTRDVLALTDLKQDLWDQNVEYLDTMYSIVEKHDWCLNTFNFHFFIETVIGAIATEGALHSAGIIAKLAGAMYLSAAIAATIEFAKLVTIVVLGVADLCFLSTSFANPAFVNAYVGFVLTEWEMSLVDEIMTKINLVLNPGFEHGLDSWSSTAGTAIYESDSSTFRTGFRSAKGVETSTGNLGRLYQDVTAEVSPGGIYKIGGWIKTQGVDGHVVIALDYVTSGGWSPADGYVKEIGYVSGTQDWTYYESDEFLLPPMPASCVAAWFLFDFNAGKGTAWWDDVFLIRIDTELYYDDGSVEGWSTCGGPTCEFWGAAVLFTPPTSPWTLCSIKVQVQTAGTDDGAPFFVEIWDENRSELFRGTYVWSDYFSSGDEEAEIDIPDIEVMDDFYVCFFPNNTPSNSRWTLFDYDLPYSGRSYVVYYDTNTIYGDPRDNDWMIRAVGRP